MVPASELYTSRLGGAGRRDWPREARREVNTSRPEQSNPETGQGEMSAEYLLGGAQLRLSDSFSISGSRVALTPLHRLEVTSEK